MTDADDPPKDTSVGSEARGPGRRQVGMGMLAVGALGVVAAVIGVVVGMQLVAQIDTAMTRSLALTSDSLRAVEESVQVAGATMAMVEDGLGEAERTARSLVATIEDGEQALQSIAEVTGTDVADSLEAVQDSMPTLIQVASAIDTSLSALSRLPFGPPYDPERPFDESLRSVQRSLDGLPEQLRGQADVIEQASGSLGRVGAGASGVADSLAQLDQGMSGAVELLEGYSATTTQARDLVAETEGQLDAHTSLARATIVLLGIVFALMQIVPLYVGWLLVGGHDPPWSDAG